MSAISIVIDELNRATAKFPTWPTDPLHALAILGEEFGELNKAVLQLTYEPHKSSHADVLMEAVQTAAMALRFIAGLSFYRYNVSDQHHQGQAAAYVSDVVKGMPETLALLEASFALRDDLLLRADIGDVHGCHEVNVSATQWILFNRAIDGLTAALHGNPEKEKEA